MDRGISAGTRAYIAAVSLAAMVAALLLIRQPVAGVGLASFVVITGIGALAHAYPIRGFHHQAYQVTLPFIVLAAARFNGVELVAFILAIHVVEQARLRRRLYIQFFNACAYLVSAAAALLFFHRAMSMLPAGALGELSAALAAACCFIVGNRLLVMAVLWLARGLSPVASGLFQPEVLAIDLVIAWMAGPMLVLAIEAGSWTVLVTAGPLLLARPALSAALRRAPHSEAAHDHIQAPAA